MDLPIEKIEIPRKVKIYLALLVLIIVGGGLIFGIYSWNQTIGLRTLEKEKRQLEKVAAEAQNDLKKIQAEKENANSNLKKLEKKEVKINEIHKQTRTNTDNAREHLNNVRKTKRADNLNAARLCDELQREHQIKCE